MEPKDQRKVDDFIIYGMCAARQALDDAGWHPKTQDDQVATGVLIGSGIGGIEGIAKTAVDVATLPVKAASATVDAVTTSQAEADQNLGRKIRKEEEARGREARAMAERCRRGRALPTDICPAARP